MASTATLEIVLQAKDQASKNLKGVKGALKGLGKAAIAGTAAAGAAVAGLAVGIGKLAADAREIPGVQGAFEGLTRSFEGGSEAMLSALQDASYGMVNNVELMKNFNTAAQLVGKDFAERLPNAMQYLGKVSAATGQDMDFMMNSLITGIGRMSPMILDNLGIQVSLSEATARAAEMFGKEASELSKSEQQAGMMNVVLEKLRENTEDMPEVAGSAAQQWAALGTQFENLKDRIGTAFLPVLQVLLETVGPMLARTIERVMPHIEEFAVWLAENLPDAMRQVRQTWQEVWPVVQTVLQTAWAIIQPILLLLQTWLSDEGPGALQTFRENTSETFSQIQEIVTTIVTAVMGFLQPALDRMRGWWQEHGDSIRVIAEAAWNAIQSIIEAVSSAISTSVQLWLGIISAFWQAHGDTIMTVVRNTWDNIKILIDAALTIIGALIDAVAAAIQGDWTAFGEALRTVWDTAWKAMVSILRNNVNSLLNVVRDLANSIVWIFRNINWRELGMAIIHGIANGVSASASRIKDAVMAAVKAAWQAAKGFLGINCPDPSPLTAELGVGMGEGLIQGIESMIPAAQSAMQNLTGVTITSPASQTARRRLQDVPRKPAGGRNISISIGNLYGTDREAARQFSQQVASELRLQGVVS